MKYIIHILLLILFISCNKSNERKNSIKISEIKKEIKIKQKKLNNENGLFSVKKIKTGKDTLIDYNYLSQNFVISTQIDLNYPKLNNKYFNNGILILENDKIKVTIKEIKFNKSNHLLTYKDTLTTQKKYELIKIDGKEFYGSDGEIPKTEIVEIKIKYGNKQIEIGSEYLEGLYNAGVNSTTTDAYIINENSLIITFWGSDGAGSYFTALLMMNGEIETRIIDYGF